MPRGGTLPILIVIAPSLLAGCFENDPLLRSSRILEVDTPDLKEGSIWNRTFELGPGHEYAFLGSRIGNATRAHILFVSPNGTEFATARLLPTAKDCALERPTPGNWTLSVRVDENGGFLGVARLTVRAGSGPVPSAFACRNEPHPGQGAPFTILAVRNLTSNSTIPIEAPFVVDRPVTILNATLSGETVSNATVLLEDPVGTARIPPWQDPPQGAWRIRIAPRNESATMELVNATLFVEIQR